MLLEAKYRGELFYQRDPGTGEIGKHKTVEGISCRISRRQNVKDNAKQEKISQGAVV